MSFWVNLRKLREILTAKGAEIPTQKALIRKERIEKLKTLHSGLCGSQAFLSVSS